MGSFEGDGNLFGVFERPSKRVSKTGHGTPRPPILGSEGSIVKMSLFDPFLRGLRGLFEICRVGSLHGSNLSKSPQKGSFWGLPYIPLMVTRARARLIHSTHSPNYGVVEIWGHVETRARVCARVYARARVRMRVRIMHARARESVTETVTRNITHVCVC